jgi:hypothetical protein
MTQRPSSIPLLPAEASTSAGYSRDSIACGQDISGQMSENSGVLLRRFACRKAGPSDGSALIRRGA